MKPLFIMFAILCITAIIASCAISRKNSPMPEDPVDMSDLFGENPSATPDILEESSAVTNDSYRPILRAQLQRADSRHLRLSARQMANSVPAIAMDPFDGLNGESYSEFADNRFMSPTRNPLSTFSIDVDAASYANMRRYVNQGHLPPADAVRVEEMINYFAYDYPQPADGQPVHIDTEVGACPWNKAHRLVRIGLKAKDIETKSLPAANFVFLIDVSGSMSIHNRLGLVKSSMKMLTDNLRDSDRVAIVVYGSDARVVLPSTSGSEKTKIKEAIESLEAGGYTAGEAGLRLAYKTAAENFMDGGNNRIILCSDGDFNFGVSDEHGLELIVSQERKRGIFLSVLGYGMGNYKDSTMQVLAEKGNGNQAYIDNIQEARKVLVTEFGSTLFTVAEDVKLQVEFNPAQVQAYRLVGYESRLLRDEDFNDDTKDAGDIGAGHTVTALYEIIPAGVKGPIPGTVDSLKYQSAPKAESQFAADSKEMLTVKLRYKRPGESTSRLMVKSLTDKGGDNVTDDFRFASAVAMFGQLLRDSDFKGEATYDKVIETAGKGLGNDPEGYRREFVRIAEAAKSLK